MSKPVLSVVIPAYNEAEYLPYYLPTVLEALSYWEGISGDRGEIIVVDNDSTDNTAPIAQALGARIIHETVRNIAHVRNTGAAHARGEYLFFVDADVEVPVTAIALAVEHMSTGAGVGGAILPLYTPKRMGARLLCRYWERYQKRHRGAQGVNQFCLAEVFAALGGYRTDLYMSEDVEFFARLRTLGDLIRRPIVRIDEPRVVPSTRRYDQWSTWRMVWWQNPLTARMLLTSPRFWERWYSSTVR